MLKRRLIFTLLYDRGSFMLSRNFRLQRVGDLNWLQKNYVFANTSLSIDELIVLDVSRGERDAEKFCDHLKQVSRECFVPIAAGGGVRSADDAKRLLRSGADKIVVNSPLFTDPELIHDLGERFGQQCIIGSVDLKRNTEGGYAVWTENGQNQLAAPARDLLRPLAELPVGEIYLNSVDQDGTGQGYDFDMLELLAPEFSVPVILAGGAGNARHMAEGLGDARVDAVATAHLFNFVGDGLHQARSKLIAGGVELPVWTPWPST